MPIVPHMRVPPALNPFARTVTLPGAHEPLFLYEAGHSGLPGMLLVHGLGDEADTWRHVISPLSEHYHVVAPDLPGFGRSPLPPRARLAPRYLSGVLASLIEHLDLKKITLVGSSLGAPLVQVVAMENSRLISRLILVDGGLLARGRIKASLLFGLLPGVGERRYRRLAGNLDAAYASLRPYYADLEALPKEEREFLRERVGERVASESQMRAYFSFFRGFFGSLALQGLSLTRRARLLDIPTLYVWGAQDHIVPVETAHRTRLTHPGSELAVIPNAGHLPHQETPKEFLRVVA